jgi:hypothetical protein
VSRLNPLRYDIAFGSEVTLNEGPDLTLTGFIPALKIAAPTEETPARPEEKKGTKEPTLEIQGVEPYMPFRPTVKKADEDQSEHEMQRAEENLKKITKTIANLLDDAEDATNSLGGAAFNLDELVRRSDRLLREEAGVAEVTKQIHVAKNVVDTALCTTVSPPSPCYSWPSAQRLREARQQMDEVVRKFEEMPLRFSDFSTWAAKGNSRDDYRRALANARAISLKLNSIEEGSTGHTQFGQTYVKLQQWSKLLTETASESVYTRTVEVRRGECDLPFFDNKKVDIKMVTVDRIAEDSAKARTEKILATVECPSHFAITAGMGISGVDETDIKLVSVPNEGGSAKGGEDEEEPAAVNKIASVNEGSEQVNPVGLLHTRLTSGTTCDLHVTAGTVFDLDNPTSSVKLGYIVGLSFSIKDNFYLTGGLQAQRVSRILPGVDPELPVPQGITTPPIQSEWDRDWVFTVTYKLP